MAATIDAHDARLRAALAGAMLMGIVSQRYILQMPVLEDADVDDILRLITSLVRTLLHPRRGQIARRSLISTARSVGCGDLGVAVFFALGSRGAVVAKRAPVNVM